MFVWAGTSDSLTAYMELEKKFSSQVDLQVNARSSQDEDYRLGDDLITRHGNTAVLHISGGLVNAHKWWHEFAVGEITSYDAIRSAAQTLASDLDIKNVVVKFDTPGGMVKGIDTAAKSLHRLAQVKAVSGQATMACSAGYWMASYMPKLFAEDMAQVGNIGTLAVIPDFSEMLAKQGIQFHVFKAGKYKDIGLPMTPFSDEEKAAIQEHVEKSNNFFLTTVSKNRNLLLSDRETWGEAQTFFAGEAKAVGLIDGIATLEDVVGSLLTAETTYPGETGMTISAEKLAAIAAGAAPETVLTTAELAEYQAQLSAEAPKAAVEGEENPEDVDGAEGDEPKTEPTASASEHLALAKELGRVEAKLEATEAKLQAKEEAVASVKAQMEGLLVVAQAAVGNLQVALQLPKETKGTAAEVIAQFNDLQGQMKARFPQGRMSSDAPATAEPSVSSGASFHPFRPV